MHEPKEYPFELYAGTDEFMLFRGYDTFEAMMVQMPAVIDVAIRFAQNMIKRTETELAIYVEAPDHPIREKAAGLEIGKILQDIRENVLLGIDAVCPMLNDLIATRVKS